MKKVLFISHSAGRTGAPQLLLNALKWMKSREEISFEILLCEDGPLRERFESLASTRVLAKPREPSGFAGTFKAWLKKAGGKRRSGEARPPKTVALSNLSNCYECAEIDLVYANTITLGDVLERLSPIGCPAITHVHELSCWIERSGHANLEKVRKHSNLLIAASQAVKRLLVDEYDFSADGVEVIHEFVPLDPVVASGRELDQLRRSLSISKEDRVVLGSGFETERKGKDIFVELGRILSSEHPEVEWKFLWVGGWESAEDKSKIMERVHQFGLPDRFKFVGEVDNPLDYFSLGHVFTLTSREDPFPLVVLEASVVGLAVVCFEDAGGMPELIEDDAGICVEYLDAQQMAEAVARLATDIELAESLNRAAVEKIRNRYSVSVGAAAQIRCIEKTIEAHRNEPP